jgi:hypothetical protein
MAANQPKPSSAPHRPRIRWWLAIAAALLGVNYLVVSNTTREPARVRVPYTPFFVRQIADGNVEEITSKGTTIQGVLKHSERYNGSRATTRFETEIPEFADTDALARSLAQAGVVVNAKPLQTSLPWWQNVLLNFGPTLLFLGLLVWITRRSANAQSLLGSFSRSNAKRYAPGGDRVTFADVAGIDDAKEELVEVVDFLRRPDKYRKLGGRIPHGVLLSGQPGTGKTLLARAVAGEAEVPFFAMAASEFVEAIVGVGAARVRDLFKEAKNAAPAIVFVEASCPRGCGRSRARARASVRCRGRSSRRRAQCRGSSRPRRGSRPGRSTDGGRCRDGRQRPCLHDDLRRTPDRVRPQDRGDRLEPEAPCVHQRARRRRRRHPRHRGQLSGRQGPDDRSDRLPPGRARAPGAHSAGGHGARRNGGRRRALLAELRLVPRPFRKSSAKPRMRKGAIRATLER